MVKVFFQCLAKKKANVALQASPAFFPDTAAWKPLLFKPIFFLEKTDAMSMRGLVVEYTTWKILQLKSFFPALFPSSAFKEIKSITLFCNK